MLLNRDQINKSDKIIIEQYKLYMEMAERIKQQKINTNVYYTSLFTLLFSATSLFFIKSPLDSFVICVIISFILVFLGFFFGFVWYIELKRLEKIASAKDKVIFEMERYLPLMVYEYEWKLLCCSKKKPFKPWTPSKYLNKIPKVLSIAYTLFIILKVLSLFVIN